MEPYTDEVGRRSKALFGSMYTATVGAGIDELRWEGLAFWTIADLVRVTDLPYNIVSTSLSRFRGLSMVERILTPAMDRHYFKAVTSSSWALYTRMVKEWSGEEVATEVTAIPQSDIDAALADIADMVQRLQTPSQDLA